MIEVVGVLALVVVLRVAGWVWLVGGLWFATYAAFVVIVAFGVSAYYRWRVADQRGARMMLAAVGVVIMLLLDALGPWSADSAELWERLAKGWFGRVRMPPAADPDLLWGWFVGGVSPLVVAFVACRSRRFQQYAETLQAELNTLERAAIGSDNFTSEAYVEDAAASGTANDPNTDELRKQYRKYKGDAFWGRAAAAWFLLGAKFRHARWLFKSDVELCRRIWEKRTGKEMPTW